MGNCILAAFNYSIETAQFSNFHLKIGKESSGRHQFQNNIRVGKHFNLIASVKYCAFVKASLINQTHISAPYIFLQIERHMQCFY